MESIKVEMAKRMHYFRSISELKGCKHGGYLEGTIQFPSNTKKIELRLVTLNVTENIEHAPRYADPMIQKLVKETHCNLFYVSSHTPNHRPDLSRLRESAWRVFLERRGDQMILDRQNHSYLEDEECGLMCNVSVGKLFLGSKGLRLTIVKPLFKENKANRPGIYVSDVLKERFKECISEITKFTPEEKTELQSKFEAFEINADDEEGQESFLIKNGGMYKVHLLAKCTLNDGSIIDGISQLVIASNKYAIEVDLIHQNQVLISGLCQSFLVAFKKCEPTLKMSIKAGFKFTSSNGSNELIPNGYNLIRVIETKRRCKGYAVEVTFQTLPNFITEFNNEMQLFLVLKVFEKTDQGFDCDDYQFIEEIEITKFIGHNCDFHQVLSNNTHGHKSYFKRFLLDASGIIPAPCGLCQSHVLPAITNLLFKPLNKLHNDKAEELFTDEDFTLLYEKIFKSFFDTSDHEAKRPRLQNRNDDRFGGYAT